MFDELMDDDVNVIELPAEDTAVTELDEVELAIELELELAIELKLDVDIDVELGDLITDDFFSPPPLPPHAARMMQSPVRLNKLKTD